MSRPAPRPQKAQPERVFAPGARVVVRNEEWMVRTTHATSTGGLAVAVTGLSELVRGMDAIFLDELDPIVELRPEETKLVSDDSPQYRRSRLYLESLLRQTPPADARLYVGHRGAMDPAAYQLVPAAKALARPKPSILIADAVGLGKTIEVGVLLSELIRRGRGRRILVVALKSVLAQFQKELWTRFTIPLVRLDSVGLQRVQRKIPANQNPFYYFPRAIISIDTLKKDRKYQRFIENGYWDAIVIDECQHVAARGSGGKSQRARLAEVLATRCDALIMTSATPHDGRPESFASLMNLLDPTAVADPSSYTKEEIGGLYVRRFKKDIAHEVRQAFQERSIHARHIPASREENAVFDRLATAEFRTIQPRSQAGRGILFRTLLIKSLLSSPEALRETIKARLGQRALAEDAGGRRGQDAQHDVELLQEIDALAARIKPERFAKLAAFLDLLRTMGVDDPKADHRVVVFSERIKTLELLEEQIRKHLKLTARQIAVFHGTLDDQRQKDLVEDFGKESSAVRVLLASDAAAEGINLHHHCHRMIHFDIPWSLITVEQRNGRIDRYGQPARPDIHYLLTVPDHEELRGDLRVLDLLIQREKAANENLGDACWLMGLHSADEEVDRVAEGISRHEPAEKIIPEEPPPMDFLQVLMGAAADEQERERQAPETVEPLRLFPSDYEFAREALAELCAQGAGMTEPEWHEHVEGLTLDPPPDLLRRFTYLPPELSPDALEIKLTARRDLVQKALADSRKEQDRWPEWQLLWELHPVMEWLHDRVVAHFTRHEAPVVLVPKGLSGGEVVFLFEGVLSNGRSQPVLVDWFGVKLGAGASPGVVTLRDLCARTGLDAALSNDGRPVDTSGFEALREQAVAEARAHMRRRRLERRDQLLPLLLEEKRRMSDWHRRGLARLEAMERAIAEAGRAPRQDERKRIADRREELARRVEARNTWISDGITTNEEPYLRVAMVLAPAAPAAADGAKAGRGKKR